MRHFGFLRASARALLWLGLALAFASLAFVPLGFVREAEADWRNQVGAAAAATDGAGQTSNPEGKNPDAPAPEEPAPPPSQQSGASTETTPPTTPDYYGRRASETLKQDEKQQGSAPHPLAAAYPDYTVVVCEAGCLKDRGAEIVFMERHAARVVVDSAVMVPTSSGPARGARAVAAPSPTIDCLGGCYDTPKRYAGALVSEQGSSRADASALSKAGGWVTTVSREGGTSGPLPH